MPSEQGYVRDLGDGRIQTNTLLIQAQATGKLTERPMDPAFRRHLEACAETNS